MDRGAWQATVGEVTKESETNGVIEHAPTQGGLLMSANHTHRWNEKRCVPWVWDRRAGTSSTVKQCRHKSDMDFTKLIVLAKGYHYFANKGPFRQGYGFASGHVWMRELDCEESWVPKNWCFWAVVLEKTLLIVPWTERIDPRETLGPRETGLKTVTAAVFMMARINPMIDEQMHCYTYKLVFWQTGNITQQLKSVSHRYKQLYR